MSDSLTLVRSFDYPASGKVRTGTLYRSVHAAAARPAVVVIHGLLVDRRLPEIDLFCRQLCGEFDVVTADMRGHGEGPGLFTWGREEHKDLADLVRFLHALHPAVGAVGFSYGGYVAILSAALARGREEDARPDALCTVGAPAHMDLWRFRFRPFGCLRHIKMILGRRRRRFAPGRPRLRWARAVDLVAGVAPVPLMIIHGERDWLVHPDHARQLYEAAAQPKELLVIPEGLHAEYIIAQDPALLVAPAGRFFGRTLTGVKEQGGGSVSPSAEVSLRRDRS